MISDVFKSLGLCYILLDVYFAFKHATNFNLNRVY